MIVQSRLRSVGLLSVGAFVVGTDAHSVAGLLSEMARSLRTSVVVVGQSVTVFALSYAVLAPVTAVLMARRVPRTTLATALIVFAVGNVVSASAMVMPLLLLGRVVAAAGAAMFTPTAGAMAVRIAGPEKRGTALALVTAGASSALVLGAPAGAAVAAATSWRVTLIIIAALGLLMIPGLLLMPAVAPTPVERLPEQLKTLRSPRVRATLGISVVAFAGVFIPYTYLSQSYAPLVEALPGGIGTVLLMFGLTSVVGALSSGPLADRTSARWLVVAVAGALALVDVAAVIGRGSVPVLVVALLLAGFLSWSILAPQQHQLITDQPDHAAVLISFNAAAGYAGISLAGGLGAAAITAVGPAHFSVFAAILLIIAALWRALSPRPMVKRLCVTLRQ